MSAGKKLTVVLSVGVVGVSVATFFWGGAFWHGGADDPFGTHVERRVGSGAVPAADRLPAATAAITQLEPPSQAPAYHESYRPVGTLLAPIDSVPAEPDEAGGPAATESTGNSPFAAGGVLRHTVEDGDTLTKLALRYLGRADAYLRIYEANRAILSNPDLLPIGAVLTIPPRASSPAGASPAGLSPAGLSPAVSTWPAAEPRLEMVPVPQRPDAS